MLQCDLDDTNLCDTAKIDEAMRAYMASNQDHWFFREGEMDAVVHLLRKLTKSEQDMIYETDAAEKAKKRVAYYRLLEALSEAAFYTSMLEPPKVSTEEEDTAKENIERIRAQKDAKKKKAEKDEEQAKEKGLGKDQASVKQNARLWFRNEYIRRVLSGLLDIGSYFRQDVRLMKAANIEAQYQGTHGGVSRKCEYNNATH